MQPTPIGKLLRERREQARLTQDTVARELGIERPTYTHIENGLIRGVSPEMAEKLVKLLPVTGAEIARALGFPIEDATGLLAMVLELREQAENMRIKADSVTWSAGKQPETK